MLEPLTGASRRLTAQPVRYEPVERLAINFVWFHKLRWTAIVGQVLAVLLSWWALSVELPWRPMMGLIALAALTNIVLGRWLNARQASGWEGWQRAGVALLGSVMVFDNLVLTAILYCSGGPANPFTIFYLINISLAAVVLDARWAWMLCGLALTCFSLLFWGNIPIPELAHPDHTHHTGHSPSHTHGSVAGHLPKELESNPMHLHLQGMLVAFGAASALIVYFITRVTTALNEREIELAVGRDRKAHHDKLESLATLAAGAAHELATPLSTIAIVARELEIDLQKVADRSDVAHDVRIIREEVDRCRRILNSMATSAGESVGEELMPTPVRALIEAALADSGMSTRLRTTFAGTAGERRLHVPIIAVGQALRSLVKNALDASPANQFVAIEVRETDNGVTITIVDQGTGMTDDELRRAGDPFFSTKEPGQGMGLGLFLARQVIERIGGSLTLTSQRNVGTTATVELPRDCGNGL